MTTLSFYASANNMCCRHDVFQASIRLYVVYTILHNAVYLYLV